MIFVGYLDDKYTILDARPTFASNVESRFKHYAGDEVGAVGPEVINVTSSAGAGTILPPDQVIDVSRAPSLATLNGIGVTGGGTLPRSTMSRSHHGTLRKQHQGTVEEQRPLTSQYPYEPG